MPEGVVLVYFFRFCLERTDFGLVSFSCLGGWRRDLLRVCIGGCEFLGWGGVFTDI